MTQTFKIQREYSFDKADSMARMTHVDLMLLLLSLQLLILHHRGADSSSINLKSKSAAFANDRDKMSGKLFIIHLTTTRWVQAETIRGKPIKGSL